MQISFPHNFNPAHASLKQYSPCFGLDLKTYTFAYLHWCALLYCTYLTRSHAPTQANRYTDTVYINLQLIYFQHIYVLIVWLILTYFTEDGHSGLLLFSQIGYIFVFVIWFWFCYKVTLCRLSSHQNHRHSPDSASQL